MFLGLHWLAMLLAASAIAQQEPQFRVDTANVTVKVVMTDRQVSPSPA
jgi:hypothetical protein